MHFWIRLGCIAGVRKSESMAKLVSAPSRLQRPKRDNSDPVTLGTEPGNSTWILGWRAV